jgi:hypothetical protein
MTKKEWLACTKQTTPARLTFFQGKLNDRKLRLFAVACCRTLVEQPFAMAA